MKLRIDDVVYLQKYEVAYIMHEVDNAPGSILQECFNGGEEGCFFMCDLQDGFRFDCAFKEPKNIKWLMEQDWIIDYNLYERAFIAELNTLLNCLKAELSSSIEEFNTFDEDYRKEHYAEENEKLIKLKHKIISFEFLIDYRKGKNNFVFPNGYCHKTASTVATPDRKKSLFSRLFGHRA